MGNLKSDDTELQNEPKGIFTWAKISFPLKVGRGERNFPPTFVLNTNPSLLKGLGV